MKKIIIAAILIVGLATGFAYAHNTGWGMGGYGGHMMGGGTGMMGGGTGMMGGGTGMMGGGTGMMGGGSGMMGGGYGDCPGGSRFGQNGWNGEGYQKFLDDTVGLRKELNDKNFQYMEAQRNPNTSREQLATIEKEIIDLRTNLQDKAEQY